MKPIKIIFSKELFSKESVDYYTYYEQNRAHISCYHIDTVSSTAGQLYSEVVSAASQTKPTQFTKDDMTELSRSTSYKISSDLPEGITIADFRTMFICKGFHDILLQDFILILILQNRIGFHICVTKIVDNILLSIIPQNKPSILLLTDHNQSTIPTLQMTVSDNNEIIISLQAPIIAYSQGKGSKSVVGHFDMAINVTRKREVTFSDIELHLNINEHLQLDSLENLFHPTQVDYTSLLNTLNFERLETQTFTIKLSSPDSLTAVIELSKKMISLRAKHVDRVAHLKSTLVFCNIYEKFSLEFITNIMSTGELPPDTELEQSFLNQLTDFLKRPSIMESQKVNHKNPQVEIIAKLENQNTVIKSHTFKEHLLYGYAKQSATDKTCFKICSVFCLLALVAAGFIALSATFPVAIIVLSTTTLLTFGTLSLYPARYYRTKPSAIDPPKPSSYITQLPKTKLNASANQLITNPTP